MVVGLHERAELDHTLLSEVAGEPVVVVSRLLVSLCLYENVRIARARAETGGVTHCTGVVIELTTGRKWEGGMSSLNQVSKREV